MSTANPPFYTGPDLSLPDADDFLHNPSTAATPASQAVGDTAESGTTDSKGTFLLDWNLHYDDHEAAVQENLPDSSLFSDLMVDFGNTGGDLSTQPFPSDQILELNSSGMEIFSNNEEMLSPKRSKILPPFSGPAQLKTSKISNTTTTGKKETKASGVLNCICNQPQTNRFILVCDKCDKWFHCECVGISQDQGEEMSRERHIWLCPVCNESTTNKTQAPKHVEPKSHIATRSQNKLEPKVPILKIPKRSLPVKEGKRCYLKSCQKRLTNQSHHFCSNNCIEVTVSNLKSFYQIKGLPSADSERVTLLDKSSMRVITGVSAPTLGGLASWLKSHSTHVPIKPQPRPSQDISVAIKHEVKLESPLSDHEEIVRGKARKQLSDILLSRVESSPEYTKYSDSIPKVASQIEAALYTLDRSISTRYKNRYRSLSFSLRDPKNFGLYRRVVSGETLPENLVQMSTEQLAPGSSNSSKDAKNNSNTDISTTRSKTLDKQQSSGSSGEMARKNVHNQPKSQDSSKYLFDEKNKQNSYGSKQLKPQTSKSNDIPPLMTTEIDILPPKFSPTLSDSDEHPDMDKIVWRGSISMPNLAKCATNGCLAYGPYIPEMEKILPQNVQVHGRIIYSMVWDYLKKIISSTTKGLVVLRLIPRSREEETSFTTLFNYFHKRQRCGVAGGCTATVRDLYLLPFTKGDVIPTLLTSLQGPGVPPLKTDTLLAMIVTNKITESSPNTTAMKRSVSDTDATITAELRANDQKSNLSKQDISSLTNPSAPLPFASIQSKSELPFSSSVYSESSNVPSNEITSKLFNPSDLYKPISESESSDSRKDTYMIPYDKAKSESPFKFNLGSGNTGDHIFPGLGEILKKSMDDPIIEDALSNLHFKKPLKEGQITSDATQKFHTEYGVQYPGQGQYGYNNPPSNYTGYSGTEKPVEAGQLEIQAIRSQPQTNTHPYYPHDSQVPNTDQYNRSQNVSYYGQEHVQHSSEHQLQQGQHVSGHVYPSHETQMYPHNTTDYWQQESIDAQHKQKQHELLPNQQYQPDGYPHQQWAATSHNQSAKNPQQRPYEQEYPRYPHAQNEQYPQHEDYTRVQKHDTYPPSQTPQDNSSPEHRLPLHLQDNQSYPEHRQMEQYRRPTHEYSQQNEHVGEYGDHRLQRDQYQGDRYFDRGYLDKEQQLRHDESEKNRDLYPHQHDMTEADRDWKPPYGHPRDEDKWTGNDRRGLDRNLAGGGYKQEREEDIWELERARSDYRLTDADLIDRPLHPYRRLPLRTILSHLDLARRDLGSLRGRGSPIGIGTRPSLLERDRARIKRDFAPDTDMLGVPLKLYRTLESPPKPSFEPISRTRPTLRVRKRDRMRKSPKLRSRDESKDDESIGSRKERRSRRRSRFSKSRDAPKKEEANDNSRQDKTADTTQSEITSEKPLETKHEISTDEIYPQVVQEVDNNSEATRKNTTPQDTGIQTSDVPSQAEDEKLSKFPPKHLQREKLLAMQEKLHNSTPSKSTERNERGKHRSRTRSRERDSKGGRRKRSRSREWGRRTHSRDDTHREKEPASLIRERLIREREAQPSLRERQLLVLEREREILRARARFSIPSPGAIDGIRERSPLRVGDLDSRRTLVTPFIRSRALDELRRERIERGVPGGVFRGQYLYQGPRQ